MQCRLAPMLAALVAAAVALPFASIELAAQTPEQADVVFDPPNTVYSFGFVPEDPVVERKRAIVPRHRAFLPVSVDLASRMPPIGYQGSPCVARTPVPAHGFGKRFCHLGSFCRRLVRG